MRRPLNHSTMSITGGNLIYFLKVTALKKPPEEGAVYVPSADVFSATVVVWECLTAQEPYISPVDLMALSPVELMDAVVGGLRPALAAFLMEQERLFRIDCRHWWRVGGTRTHKYGILQDTVALFFYKSWRSNERLKTQACQHGLQLRAHTHTKNSILQV